MSNQIRITPDQMKRRAGEYRTEADAVNGVITRMDNLLKHLQDEWEGESSRAYGERFMELRPGFVKAEELIQEIARALDSTANIIEQTDRDIASQFRA